MDVSHNFRFRWNDHVPHLSQIFSELRFDEVYCDTTIISDDGFVLKAHGAVLSATSRYFERVLSDVTTDQHPIIVLKGANFTELSCLLDYIYEGVTQVDQHLMESVLDVADMLEIKGLSKMKNNLSIKKLIAPSPSSSVVSRSSLQSSSPAKSPMPPSHTSQTHSPPSCPSSPNEPYVPSSAMLKMDNDDSNEVADPSQKKRHLFHDGKSPMNAGLAESKDYSSTVVTSTVPSHIPVCQTSNYSDQTLGIDLSLSRPTNEENERTTKNCNLQEEAPLRKRKIMKYEEFSPSTDLEWGKIGEKVKDSVLHKKSRFLTRSDDDLETEPQMESHSFSSSAEFLPYELAPRKKRVPSPCIEDSSIWRHIKQQVLAKRLEGGDQANDSEFSLTEDYSQFDSDFNADSEGGSVANNSNSLSVSGPSHLNHHEVFVKQEPSTAAGVYSNFNYSVTERSNGNRSPTYKFFNNDSSEGSEELIEDVWSFPGIVNVGTRNKRTILDAHFSKVPKNESTVADFVSVKLCQMNNPTASEGTQHHPGVQGAFQDIDTRLKKPTPEIKRPLSKYTLFIKEMYPVIARQYTTNKARDIMKIISSVWRNMTEEEKRPWEVKANELLQDFKRRHPNYVFSPRALQLQKQEYYIKRAERRNMFRINPYANLPSTF